MRRLYLLLTCLCLLSCSSDKQKDKEKEVNPFYERAHAYRDAEKADSAFIFFTKAKDIFVKKHDTLRIASCLVNLAIISTNMGDYFGGQELSLSAIAYLKKDDKAHYVYLHSNYNNLGITSERLRDYRNAANFYDLAIKFATDSPTIQLYLNNKANAYQEAKQFKNALAIYHQLIKEPHRDPTAYARVLANIAMSKWQLNANYNALPELMSALTIRRKQEDLWGLNSNYAYLSDYYAKKNIDSALFYGYKMLSVADTLNSPDDQLFALQKLIRFSPTAKRNAYFEKYLKLDDSLQTARNLSKNRFALIKFETEKHKADNLVLQQENSEKTYQIIIIITVSILVLAMGLFWYRKRQQHIKLTAEKTIKENQLKTSKKVHDVVANGLYRVMTEIENVDELDREQLLDKIEDMYIKSRNISYNIPVTPTTVAFHEKLARLLLSFRSNRVSIDLTGNTDDFWNSISEEKRYELEQVLQELLVNMDKHSQATHVAFNFSMTANQAIITYKDNGIGLPQNVTFNNGLTSTGTRIENISGSITFETIDPNGLEIIISFPV